MKIVETTVSVPMRRVTLELPEERAKELKVFLESKIAWSATPVGPELETLHKALGGWRS